MRDLSRITILIFITFSLFLLSSCGQTATTFIARFQQGVYPDASFTDCADAFVASGSGATGDQAYTAVGMGFGDENSLLISFGIASFIPAGAKIQSAVITLSVETPASNGPLILEARQLTSEWDEATVDGLIGSEDVVVGAGSVDGDDTGVDIILDVFTVERWIATGYDEMGLIIRVADVALGRGVRFHSAQCADANDAPLLTVQYSL